jgi:hypothetical protein
LKKGIDVGIYKCIIHKSVDELIHKLFVFNRNNYYTHFDLMLARELDLTIELSTVKPNAIIWGRSDYLRGEQVFTKYVDLLFDLKLKKIPGSKDILNIIWGALSQKNEITLTISEDSKEIINIEDDSIFSNVYPRNDKETIIKFCKNNNYYETNYARIAPFILARGRYYISKTVRPFIKYIKRLHTDGFISTVKLDLGDQIGTDLGQLKEKYYSKVTIMNNIKITKVE